MSPVTTHSVTQTVRCAFLGQSFWSPRVHFRTDALWDILDAIALRLIGCKSAACFVHVHHCALRRSVSSLFTFARRRLCFLLGSLMVLLGSTFSCSLFLATKNDSARLAAPHEDSALPFSRACCRWQHYLRCARFRVASTFLACGH